MGGSVSRRHVVRAGPLVVVLLGGISNDAILR